ncbi:MAG: YkgJ family cysteine cluster protein [Candidatus Njordarchaeia archaeon]
MGILDGEICLKNNCHKCCINTEMILTPTDIERIKRHGYKLESFAYFDGKYWRLKNRNGKCVFLQNDGRCSIYSYRPSGCRSYPVIFDESTGKCILDGSVCPYIQHISEKEIKKGCTILIEILKELGEL